MSTERGSRHGHRLAAALLAVGQLSAPQPGNAGDPVVATVGTETLFAADVLRARDHLRQLASSPDRRARIRPLIEAKLLVCEALARDLATDALARDLRRFANARLVDALERVELREPIDRLATIAADSILTAIDRPLSHAPDARQQALRDWRRRELQHRQLAYLEQLQTELAFTVIDSAVTLFVTRIEAWAAVPAESFGFTPAERRLALFTYRLGATPSSFTIDDFLAFMRGAGSEQIRRRAAAERVRRDLDHYFRHTAYAELARQRGYGTRLGIDVEVRRRRDRQLIEALETQVGGAQADYDSLLARLEATYPIRIDDDVLAALPLD